MKYEMKREVILAIPFKSIYSNVYETLIEVVIISLKKKKKIVRLGFTLNLEASTLKKHYLFYSKMFLHRKQTPLENAVN